MGVLRQTYNGNSGQAITSLPWNHTIDLDTTLLSVVAWKQGSAGVLTCTYDGIALTQRASKQHPSDSTSVMYIFELARSDLPPPGTYSVQLSLSAAGGIIGHSASYAGVREQSPEATAVQTGGPANNIQLAVSSLTDGALIISGVAFQGVGGQAAGIDISVGGSGSQTLQQEFNAGTDRDSAFGDEIAGVAGSYTHHYLNLNTANFTTLVMAVYEQSRPQPAGRPIFWFERHVQDRLRDIFKRDPRSGLWLPEPGIVTI